MAKRCTHMMLEGHCPIVACSHYDGGTAKTRPREPGTVKCHLCKSRVPKEKARRLGRGRFDCVACSACEFCGKGQRLPSKRYCGDCRDKHAAPKPCIHGCGITLTMHAGEHLSSYMLRESCIPCARARASVAMRVSAL